MDVQGRHDDDDDDDDATVHSYVHSRMKVHHLLLVSLSSEKFCLHHLLQLLLWPPGQDACLLAKLTVSFFMLFFHSQEVSKAKVAANHTRIDKEWYFDAATYINSPSCKLLNSSTYFLLSNQRKYCFSKYHFVRNMPLWCRTSKYKLHNLF